MKGYYCCNCDNYQDEKFQGGVCGGCGMSTLSDTPVDCEECDECGEFKPKFKVLFDDEEYETDYVCEECYKKYEETMAKYNKRFE